MQRQNRTREEGLRLAEQYLRSGMTQAEFSDGQGVTLASLRYWVWQSRREGQRKLISGPARFVEVRANGAESGCAGGLWVQTKRAALQFEQVPPVQYLVQLLCGMRGA